MHKKLIDAIINLSKHILLVVILLCASQIITVFITDIGNHSAFIPNQESGRINFNSWNFEKKGIANLNGKWEFYWNKLYTYKDLKNDLTKPDIYAMFQVYGIIIK